MSLTDQQRQRLQQLEELSISIDEAFDNEDWEGVEMALEQRNKFLAGAFPDDLAAELHNYARDIYQRICSQQDKLLQQSLEIQTNSGAELQSLKKNLTSIKAYQEN